MRPVFRSVFKTLDAYEELPRVVAYANIKSEQVGNYLKLFPEKFWC